MATTCKLIAKNVLGSATASVEFTGIPQTGYTDLLLLMSVRSAQTGADPYRDPLAYNFNGSTSGYSTRTLYGQGTGAGSNTPTTSSVGGVTYGRIMAWGVLNASGTSNTFSSCEMYVPNYAGSANKSWSFSYVQEGSHVGAGVEAVAGLWSNTAAITSVKFVLNSGSNFVAGSSFYLYGITKA